MACARVLGIECHRDESLAAIGEHWRRHSRKARHFRLVALGTGIGMGIFADGHLSAASGRGPAKSPTCRSMSTLCYRWPAARHQCTAVGSAGIIERYHRARLPILLPPSTVRDVVDRLEPMRLRGSRSDEVGRIVTTASPAVPIIARS